MERGARIMEKSSFSIFLHENSVRVLYVLLPVLLFAAAVMPANAQIWDDFTVWYDGNGAESGRISEVKYKSGTNEITLKKNEKSADGRDMPFVRNGCSFLGWSLEPSEGSVITPILSGGSQWEPLDVPVTWEENKKGFVFYARWDCPDALMIAPPAAQTPGSGNAAQSSLMISPSGQTEEAAAPAETVLSPAAVLLAPEGRSSAKNVDPAAAGGAQRSSASLPLKFSTDIDDLPTLPSTGITSASAIPMSGKPASVSYEPVSMELQIPTLDIIGDIVLVKFTDDSYPTEWLGMNIGMLEGTNLPGEGFSVLAAHNTLDAQTYGPFALLSEINVGDHIFIRKQDGRLLIFEIYSNEKISEYDFEALYKQGYQFDNTVTLMTCEDERIEGGYASRRIVSAKIVN